MYKVIVCLLCQQELGLHVLHAGTHKAYRPINISIHNNQTGIPID